MAIQDRTDDGDEPELDPAAERVRKKLATLLLGSLGVMMLGLVAVFAAILYKVSFEPGNDAESAGTPLPAPATAAVEGRIALPPGSEIVSTSLDGIRALLHVRSAEGEEGLIWVDLQAGRVLARHDLAPE